MKAAEVAFASESTSENYQHIVEIQAALQDLKTMEALVDGFGVRSGRAAGNG